VLAFCFCLYVAYTVVTTATDFTLKMILSVEIRMLQTGTQPDDESYNLVVNLLIKLNRVDSTLKYLDLMLKSGYTISSSVFVEYVRACVRSGRLDTLASVIEKCKVLIILLD
jgi:pentatricopeptide repeat protein